MFWESVHSYWVDWHVVRTCTKDFTFVHCFCLCIDKTLIDLHYNHTTSCYELADIVESFLSLRADGCFNTLTLYSCGVKLHGGISGSSVGRYLRADFWHTAPVKWLWLASRKKERKRDCYWYLAGNRYQQSRTSGWSSVLNLMKMLIVFVLYLVFMILSITWSIFNPIRTWLMV